MPELFVEVFAIFTIFFVLTAPVWVILIVILIERKANRWLI